MAETVLAAVRTGPSRTELRESPMPAIPEDSALLRMEVAGICGTDVKLYKRPTIDGPVTMGHENVGVIEAVVVSSWSARACARATGCSWSTTSVACGARGAGKGSTGTAR